MFSKAGDFLRRHRRKFLIGGVVAGGIYVTHRFVFSTIYRRLACDEKDLRFLDTDNSIRMFSPSLGFRRWEVC